MTQSIHSRNVVVLIGTRPEAIKLAPLVRQSRTRRDLRTVVVTSGQHRALLDDTLEILGIDPDMRLPQTNESSLVNVASSVLSHCEKAFQSLDPDVLVVQGDTTTAVAGALAAFYAGIPVAHVEAGLRTNDLANPFPEEGNRQIIDRISEWHFAPTEGAARYLAREGLSTESIYVTGNTGIDSLLWMLNQIDAPQNDEGLLLVTLHRRESAGHAFREILLGLNDFLASNPAVRTVWPIHPNPIVREALDSVPELGGRIDLIDPQPYDSFVRLMMESRVIISDSGGVQEEAPSLGKPVLVVREATERPEATFSGRNRIVGRTRRAVQKALQRSWSEPQFSGPLPAPNPYGDGRAAERIIHVLMDGMRPRQQTESFRRRPSTH
jgi:UDP-N-acetylglucosamine 2-epimerase (non-hydrolysing)